MGGNIRIILVNGLLELDSGKTVLGLSILTELRKRGINVAPFKPIAGHNAWFQLQSLLNSIENKILVGDDAYKYYIAMGKSLPIELINPFDFILAPPELKDHRNVTYYLNALQNIKDLTVMFRISEHQGSSYKNRYYVVLDNYTRIINSLKPLFEKLIEVIGKSFEVISRDDLERFLSNEKMFSSIILKHLNLYKNFDVVIVESYNNVISPIPLSSVEPNVVLTVMPGQVFAYEGVKYKKAYELIRGSGVFSIYTIETTHSIFKVLRPDGTFDFNICSKKDEYCLSDVSKIVDWLLTRI